MSRYYLCIAMTFVVPIDAAQAAPIIDFVESPNQIDVRINEELFTSYQFGLYGKPGGAKPVLVPVRSPSGIEVTRRYPVTELLGGSDDHPHHIGIFFAIDNVNGVNFWNNKKQSPQIKHIETKSMTEGEGSATLSTRSHWIGENGIALLQEDRAMTFSAGEHEGEYAIDFSIELSALVDEVKIEDIEEGMFAIRYTDWLREPENGEGVRPGKRLPKESLSGTGRYFSSNGDETADEVWGKRARWVAIQGVRGGKVVGVAMLNHPESLNYPTHWHARDYGLFTANPLGQGDFERQDGYKKNDPIYLNLTIEKGERAHFRFKVIVFEGLRSQAQIESRFKEFAR
jgi:hypothetical protein